MRFRSKIDRTIDRAHSAICDAENRLAHYCFTPEQEAKALDELARASRWLARACKARADFWASNPGNYDECPDVPENEQPDLLPSVQR